MGRAGRRGREGGRGGRRVRETGKGDGTQVSPPCKVRPHLRFASREEFEERRVSFEAREPWRIVKACRECIPVAERLEELR